ncbi:MAG: (2Fe-2S)-binding protein [Lautropia sp.]
MKPQVHLLVNGRSRRCDADPTASLLHVLREDLGLYGTRAGCEAGHCGACTVLVEGRAIQSCSVAVRDLDGRPVRTIESLAADGAPHPVQQAFVVEQAAQCGYCTAGIVMTVVALLEADPRVDDERIRQALARHLCRCGAQTRIWKAIRRARDRAQALPTKPGQAA